MSRVLISELARQDLIELYRTIAADKIEPAERFLTVAQESFQRVADMPKIGRSWNSSNPRLSGMRVYPLPQGYGNYLVFYRPIKRGIEVFRVLNAARDIGALLDGLVSDEAHSDL